MAALLLVAVTFSPLRSGYADAPSRGAGDVELYHAEAARIAAGDNYYTAIESELRERGYPMKSIFNWRTPLPVWLVGVLPGRLGPNAADRRHGRRDVAAWGWRCWAASSAGWGSWPAWRRSAERRCPACWTKFSSCPKFGPAC